MSSTASNTPYYKIAKKGYWYEWRHSYLSYHDVIYERAFVQSTCIFSNLSFSHLNFSHNQLKFHWAKRNWNYAKSIGFESRSGEFDVLKGQIITVAHPDVISKWRGSDLGLGVWLLFTKKCILTRKKVTTNQFFHMYICLTVSEWMSSFLLLVGRCRCCEDIPFGSPCPEPYLV